MTLLALLILMGLATWRVSSLILNEDGPRNILWHVRMRAGVYDAGEQTSMATLFSCMWCMSVWVAGVHTLLAFALDLANGPELYFLLLSSSAIAITLDTMVRREVT